MIVFPGLIFVLEGWAQRFAAAAAGQIAVLSFVGWLLLTTPSDAIRLKLSTSRVLVIGLAAWSGWCFGGPIGLIAGAGFAMAMLAALSVPGLISSPWWLLVWVGHPAFSMPMQLGAVRSFAPLLLLVAGAIAAFACATRRDALGQVGGRLARPLWLMASMLVVILLRP